MKILIIFWALVCSLMPATQPANAENTYYAKVIDSDVAFYKEADLNSAVFNLPTSFFVKIYGKEGSFYKVQYMDLDGFVRIGSVVPMDGVPTRKFPIDATISVKASNGVKLMPSPRIDNQLDAPIIYSDNGTAITYYGSVLGQSTTSTPAEWLYCKYGDQFGFIYADDCIKSIIPSDDYFKEITGELFSDPVPVAGLSGVAKTFVILGVSLPCALIIFLLIKPSLSGQFVKTKAKKRKRGHGDYFEFDENDLS